MVSNIKISPAGFAFIFIVAGSIILYTQRSWRYSKPFEMQSTDQQISLKELLSVSIEMAEMGGLEVVEVMKEKKLNEKSKGETREGANNPVTDGDMRSHRVMTHGMKKAFPNLKVISEEHETLEWDKDKVATPKMDRDEIKSITGDSVINIEDITVWIDPLDATQEYTEELLQYVTTMVCVAVKGDPVIGVIQWAWVDMAKSNGLEKPQSREDGAVNPVIIVSRSHQGAVEDVAHKSFGEKTTVIPAGGAGYKVLSLFDGTADAYVHTTLIKKWDICAGDAIIRASHEQMTTLQGQLVNYNYASKGDEKNEHGLLASLHDHQLFLEKLEEVVKG
ncbi:inositol monophosphatase 3-like [Anneissia japonica]|uniref:inositol monophosphatase 3-like n=1 Tax=Anneissia japonica TaxID=1529436 RepID=UPI0014258135|nr:inositol monophosphatase 3-like [Anneissia japonica]